MPSYQLINEHWNPKEHSDDHNSLFDDSGMAINNINLKDDTSITVNNIAHDDHSETCASMPSIVQREIFTSPLSVDSNCTDCTLIENKYMNINQCIMDDDISILSFQDYPIDMNSLTSPPSLITSHQTPE